MTDRFRPEPEASTELEDAALWYESQRAGLGLELVQAVDLALEQIEWLNERLCVAPHCSVSNVAAEDAP